MASRASRLKRFWLEVFTWWNGTTLGTRWYTRRAGVLVGEDEQGNRYYQDRRRRRRWVIYNGEAEPSRIPPGWHGWIHWRTDEPPAPYQLREWELPHEPNLTGTARAYRPPGSILRPEPTTPGEAGYQPWRPS
jgi:NADH:ubiquinone oxidoreductase subunit